MLFLDVAASSSFVDDSTTNHLLKPRLVNRFFALCAPHHAPFLRPTSPCENCLLLDKNPAKTGKVEMLALTQGRILEAALVQMTIQSAFYKVTSFRSVTYGLFAKTCT